ncbi:MAG TPA: VWA domain-containing protein [Bryobacteraceae bacterium]|nr:VWA domain-containing protein [Bryobacteraceae bacterium]
MKLKIAALMAAGFLARAQAPEVRAHESAQPFQIRVDTNLVVVRVSVRDAEGRPVGNLRKEDFRLFDEGKPREITGFTVETRSPKTVEAPASQPAVQPGATTTPAAPAPQRFVALYFDDLHMETGGIGQTRDAAWHYVSTALRPDDRVAIFTSSDTGGLDFTADREKLHDALFKLAAHSRTNPLAHQCPAIGEYQAFLMEMRQQTDMIDLAAQEGYQCHCRGINDTAECADMERRNAVIQGAQIWDLADMQSHSALDMADGVVRRLAAMPGQRLLVLVSTGFLSATRASAIDSLVDRALRRNVVVNAIDAAGLRTKAYHDPILMAAGRGDLETVKFRMENEGLEVQRDVLAGLAAGTGGTFFHNSNDFNQGFLETAQPPEISYVLSFSPADVRMDGKFHSLKVTVNNHAGWDLQARRGYFANLEAAPAKSEIQTLTFSQEERQGLPAAVTSITGGSSLTVKIHVDIGDLPFRKEADRNVNTLIFDTALFDHDGKYVAGKESSLDFRLPDARLDELRKAGINAQTSFPVTPGNYRIREIVRDAESGKVAALNSTVAVVAPPAPPVAPPHVQKKEKKAKSMADWSIADFVKAMPELEGLEPATGQEQLAPVLAGVGRNVKTFFDALPETTAHEQIDLERIDWSENRKEEFNYLALPRPAKDGVAMEEYRTNAAGKRTEPQALERGFVTRGFASMLVHFHPLYQAESQFRYLGKQSLAGHPADVVYFAQIPEKARIKQGLKTDIRSLQIMIQGVVWIDFEDYQIVRMRTELLLPHNDPDLRRETTESRFTEVRFNDVAQVFWLPAEVTVTLNWQGMVFRNRHHYSQFQLFHVDMPHARQ